MNIQRILLHMSLFLIVFYGSQYLIRFFFPGKPEVQAQVQAFARDINFADQPESPATKTVIETAQATLVFSSHGAILEQLTYKRVNHNDTLAMPIFEVQDIHGREKQPFIVALDQKTPYFYALKEVKDEATVASVIYEAVTDQATVRKTFTVHKDTFRLDLDLQVTPVSAEAATGVRIFYPAPYVSAMGQDEYATAVIGDQAGSYKRIKRDSIASDASWQPAIVGAEDKFFVNVLFQDNAHFVQSAYYQVIGQHDLITILQGPVAYKQTDWHMSFYVGPKEGQALQAVDPRFEGLLEYSGLLSPIAKLFLKILTWLYKYLHNYGWAIIVLTLLINIAFLPLNIKSMRSMKKVEEFQKKLSHVQQKYKDDPEMLKQEQSALLAKHGMPGMGCLWRLILQMPILFALSRVLGSSIQMYKAPFIFWIHDLSSADPFYILPLGITIAMAFQSSAQDPKQRFSMLAVALLFGATATNFSAGLCLYILVGLILTVLQNAVAKYFKVV